VIPVIVLQRVQDAVPLAQALVAGGVRVLEVTLRTPGGAAVHRSHRARRARGHRRRRHHPQCRPMPAPPRTPAASFGVSPGYTARRGRGLPRSRPAAAARRGHGRRGDGRQADG
jgi:2-dehydro-3-deoxyphosphogluconate aldolase/(4S)-4-hydroxy-2-oxoglutarate aldolase